MSVYVGLKSEERLVFLEGTKDAVQLAQFPRSDDESVEDDWGYDVVPSAQINQREVNAVQH